LVERFLITTADERSWKTNGPVIFLGEWCRRIDREPVWARLDALVARPVWFADGERDRIIEYIDALSRELLLELAGFLNHFHCIRKSLRFWRILLGHWIHRYTCVLFHRWHAIHQALEDHQISSTVLFTGSSLHLAASDTLSFIWACDDDAWNNALIGTILQRMSNVPLEYQSIDSGKSLANADLRHASNPTARGWRRLYDVADGALRLLQRDDEAFVIGSYLPPLQAAMLSMRLGHVPRRRRAPAVRPVAVDANLRSASRLISEPQEGFTGFAHNMLLQLLPTCFLEGFNSLKSQVEEAEWPRRPRLIFTSNSFDTSEVFKLWTAEKVETGCPYIIGQHGNNYGAARYCPSETECVETGDAFLTWGWQDDKRKCKSAFIFKTAGRLQGHWNPRGGALLIETCLPHLHSAWDPYPEFAMYQEEQFQFARNLPEAIRRALTVRLHAEHRRHGWCEEERWRRRQPAVALDQGTIPISALISKSRLVVHSYDSTGILETLSLNIPTVCFWNGGLAHLRDCAIPFYELLAAAGIFHDTAQGAADKVAEVWNDVGAWWKSEVVQKSREQFCEQYARTEPRPVRTLSRLLLDHCSAVPRGR
jgi:putative transferase (TIGR04331 family)